MPARALFTLVCWAAVAFRVAALNAQQPIQRARILGVFNAAGDAIEGAEVIDVVSRTSALTTRTGTVSLSFLPDGGSLVRVQKIGYAPTTLVVPISSVDTLPVTVVLQALGTTLPTVVTVDSAPRHISPGLRIFEEHRRNGLGRFITPAELRKNDNRSMTNVIRQLGVPVTCTRSGRYMCFAVSNRQMSKYALRGGSCAYDVYLDGMQITDKDLEAIPVNTIGAVEAYAGAASIPSEYNMTGSSCGVLLFWSRER